MGERGQLEEIYSCGELYGENKSDKTDLFEKMDKKTLSDDRI